MSVYTRSKFFVRARPTPVFEVTKIHYQCVKDTGAGRVEPDYNSSFGFMPRPYLQQAKAPASCRAGPCRIGQLAQKERVTVRGLPACQGEGARQSVSDGGAGTLDRAWHS